MEKKRTGYKRYPSELKERTVRMVLDLQRSTAVRNLIGVEDCRFNSTMDLLEKGPSPDQEVETFSIWPRLTSPEVV